jgi:predicted Zn-dependent peptidase
MKKLIMFLALAAIFANTYAQQNPREGFQQYTLQNGLTVHLWVDEDMPNVYGQVTVRAGSIDEPADYTGLAHYLEHELFKGTTTMGALDWEKEKPLYEEIIRLYDECAATKDPLKKEELIKQINEKSIEAAKYTKTDDFANLVQGIGGENLNAYTSYDVTAYHNSFPSYQMEKWLTLYYDRLINPVFRSFQAELENVFEEYNMRMGSDADAQRRSLIFSNLFEGTPYARDVIGSVEHLKNPSMTPMINFYNTWYVPNNMSLMLVGNFDAEAVKPLIEKTFGKLQPKPLPERVASKTKGFTENQVVKAKIGDYPQILWAYDGVKEGDPDQLKLEFTLSLLNNGQGVGLLDNLRLEGTVSLAAAGLFAMRDVGKIIIEGVPYFDINQRIFESDKATEKIIMKEIDKLKRGNIPTWLFTAVKNEYLQNVKRMYESSDYKVDILRDVFLYQKSIEDYFTLEEQIKAITIDDIKAIASKYFSGNYLTVSTTEGDAKVNKIKKPNVKKLDPPVGQTTQYALDFQKLPEGSLKEEYCDFSEVKKENLYKGVDLFYNENTKNDIFSLVLEYGVGTHEMPKLEYAARLMNSAGTMPNQSALDLRRELSRLGGNYGFGVDDNNFYIQVVGNEANLEKILQIITRQTLMPKLDNRQIEAILGGTVSSRMREQKNNDVLASALLQYIQYGNQSPYINRIPSKDLIKISVVGDEYRQNYLLSNTDLTTTIQDATSYAVKMYYTGKKPIEEVVEILRGNTPIKKDILPKQPEFYRTRVAYDKPVIYFLPNDRVSQASVYFYFPNGDCDIKERVGYSAFNQYFGGGFSGLVMNEIREKRSLAYTATGGIASNAKNKTSWFIGYVGSQNDKVLEAVETYMDLLTNMPSYPDRIDNIKTILKASYLSSKPSFRDKGMTYDEWQELGYSEDPAKVSMPKVEALTFDDIIKMYNSKIKDRPVVIVIQGDQKQIDIKAIQKKYGQVTKLTASKLFKGGDFGY